MNLRRTWMLVLVLAAALFAVTSTAGAKPGYFVFGGYHSIEFSLEGSNGYRIYVEKRGRQIVLLAAGKQSVAVYSPHAQVPEGSGIKARFPGVGRVSVRFHPQGPPRRSSSEPFPRCRGGELVKQRGHFVGTIRFRGEQGYTSARASRVKGAIETATKEICKRSPGEDDDSEPLADRTELWVKSESGNEGVSFNASMHGDPLDLTLFGASAVERRRGMTIFRHTSAESKMGDLVIGDTRPYPLSATVTPPAPFSGSAEYKRTPDGERTWTGSLSVSLPGLGRVPLTGPDFDPRLCQLSGCSGSSIDGHSLPLIAPTHDWRQAP
jgi:hypothetical protein